VALIDDVKGIIKDGSKRLSDSEITNNINIAISVFAKDVGVFKVASLSAYDRSLSLWNLPSDWVDGVSFIRQAFDKEGNPIDYSIVYYEGNRYVLSRDTDSIYIEYSYMPTENDLATYQKAVILHYACYLCFLALSAYYAQTIDPILSPDGVNYRDRADAYINLANEHLNAYKEKVRQLRSFRL